VTIHKRNDAQNNFNAVPKLRQLTNPFGELPSTQMQNVTLEVGDIIRIVRFGYNHVGVFVGSQDFDGRCVVHNCKGGGVVLSSLAEFADGTQVYMHQKASGNIFDREAIARRAIALVGTKYDLLSFNCEHAASLAQRGKAESPQVAGYALALLALGGLALMTKGK